MKIGRLLVAVAALGLVAAHFDGPARAEQYPSKAVNAIVGFAPGGGIDTYARALSAAISPFINDQPLVVVNRPGGAQVPAMKTVAQANPDGYTLQVFSVGSGLFATMLRDRGVDPFKDFTPVAQIGDNHLVLLASRKAGHKTPQDIIAAVKKANEEGRKVRWGHAGRGGITYMAAVAWLIKNGVFDMVQDVPFRGGSEARVAIIGDQVEFASVALTNITGFEDQLNVVGIFSAEREPTKPDVPTLGDLGSAYTPMSNPVIIVGPAGMSQDRVTILAEAIKKATETSTYKELTAKSGQPVIYRGPQETAAYLKQLETEWKPIAEFAMKHMPQ